MIKRIITTMALGILLVLFSGCASKDYVRQQNEPLLDRISKLEAEQKKCCNPEAAARAEAAAKKAEASAEKAKKAFELQQIK